ncbi:MAG TPA: insulinase family protein [Phycisphaerae bacterium]|nr:insulinase family protein [Phycisphaerae bacterium]
MNRTACRLMVGVCLSLPGAAFASPPLPTDPRIQTGQLANGVKWVFYENANPPGKLYFMMHVRTGSLNETDEQRGLSHFLEHMAFNGTENFPPGQLIPFFESIGMKFGADLNASTSYDRTNYSLNLPTTQPEQIDKALMTLSDYAFRMLLDEKEIDEERGVILEESRSRKSASQRIREKLWPELFEGSRFAVRVPIGIEEVIAGAPRSEFVKYYRTWYRPENVTVIMAGDTKVQPILPMLEKWFGAYRSEVPAAEPLPAGLKPFDRERAIVVSDPEQTSCSVQLCNVLPGRPSAATVEQFRGELLEELATRLFMRRCDERIKKGEAAFRGAQAGVEDFFREAVMVTAAASGEPGDWNKMLEQLIIELRRACEQGFTDYELDLVKKQTLASAERGVRVEPTISSSSILKTLVASVHDGEPVLSAQQYLDLVREILPGITASEVGETFKGHFDRRTYAYVLTIPEKPGLPVPARDDVLAAARAAWARRLEQTSAQQVAATLPPVNGTGRIVDAVTEEQFGVTSAWLENGIRVHHRYMDYKKDQVLVRINFAGGGIEETADNLGVTSVASLVFTAPATSQLSSTAIRDLRAGVNISVGGGMADDETFSVRLGGSPNDLEFGLHLAHTLMTDGRIEETVFKNWRISTLRSLEKRERDVGAHAADALAELISGGDPRRRTVRKEEVERLTLEQGQAWFERICRQAPAEVAIVGDISWEQVRPLVERYLGTLPTRPRSAGHLDELRTLRRKSGPLVANLTVNTLTPAAVAYAGFIGCEGRHVDDRRALQIAESIISTRLIKRVREELALVYSISASNSAAWIYRDAGLFRAGSKCKPENAELVAQEVHAILRDFAETGPTAEELDNARKQILNRLDVGIREPDYWLGFLEHLDLHGRSLSEITSQRDHYERLTAADVQAAFRKYYVPARMFTVTAVPAEASAVAAGGVGSVTAAASQPE